MTRKEKMPIFRKKKVKDYTVIANDVFKDYRLSIKELGLLTYLLSLPDDWNFSIEGLSAIRTSDGKRTIAYSLKKLESIGYIQREPIRENGKISDWVYNIYELPQPRFVDVENVDVENVDIRNEDVENVDIRNEDMRNVAQLNTKEQNTNKQNTNKQVFIRPTLEQVKKYVEENELNVDSQYFVDYYESNGWKVGKNQMKDWKATIRNWNRRNSKEIVKDDWYENLGNSIDEEDTEEFLKKEIERLLND